MAAGLSSGGLSSVYDRFSFVGRIADSLGADENALRLLYSLILGKLDHVFWLAGSSCIQGDRGA